MKSIVTTPTVISFKYKEGVITATDMHGVYGGLSKFHNLQRTFKLSNNTLISYSGEYSDIMYLQKALKYEILRDNIEITPNSVHQILQRVLYTCRSRLKPLNVTANVLGINMSRTEELFAPQSIAQDDYFLGNVNEKGNFFFSDVICTGLGAYLVTPFLRNKVDGRIHEISQEEAVQIIQDAMKLLVYRDCLALDTIQIGIVEKNMCDVSIPLKINTNWEMGAPVYE